jgi:hypothetical protein
MPTTPYLQLSVEAVEAPRSLRRNKFVWRFVFDLEVGMKFVKVQRSL